MLIFTLQHKLNCKFYEIIPSYFNSFVILKFQLIKIQKEWKVCNHNIIYYNYDTFEINEFISDFERNKDCNGYCKVCVCVCVFLL